MGRKANPQTQYKFPNLMNDRQKPKNLSPMIGQNAKGSQPGYQGDKGFFQWGTNQYGYVNPQGKINWNLENTPDPEKNRFVAAKPVQKWAMKEGTYKKDSYGMPAQPNINYQYADPQYAANMARMTGEREMTQQQYANRLSEMQSAFDRNLRQLQSAFTDRGEQEQAQLGASGFARSGSVGAAAKRLSQDFGDSRGQLQDTMGLPARERLQAERNLIDSTFRAQQNAEMRLAKERWDAQQELYSSIGESTSKLEPIKSGFEKRGSTWFYTDKFGNTTSVAGSPEDMKKKLRKR